MSKSVEPDILIKTVTSIANQAFVSTAGKLVASDEPTSKAQTIIEYQGRMSASGLEKFNGPAYLAGVSFFLNEQDRDKRRAKGAMVLYLEASNADKFFKAFGHPLADDDDEDEAANACAKVCTMLAENFKEAFADSGYPSLVLSKAIGSKNNLPEGIDFSPDQKQKQEVSFYFWKKKSLVIDISIAELPRR